MSNVLQFKSFHDRHFNPEQVKYWQQLVLNQQQQQQQPDPSQWQQYNESHMHWCYHDNNGVYAADQVAYTQEETGEYMEQEQELYYEEEEEEIDQATGLSKEAIEIFKFSEAYRKEREKELADNMEEEEEEHDKWITDAYRNGIEAPTTCLVYHGMDKNDPEATATSSSSEHIRIQEHMLNSDYLKTCRKEGQAVLWPVLPLRL